MGPEGLKETAELCVRKTAYAKEKLTSSGRFQLAFAGPTFKEFVIRDTQEKMAQATENALAAGYMAGIPLGEWYPELKNCLLVAVTEKRTKAEIDGLAAALES